MILIIVYIIVVFVILTIYIYSPHSKLVTDSISILSGLTIALGIINFSNIEKQNEINKQVEKMNSYVNNISSVFNKIDLLYVNNMKDLHNLYYEFYGFNNFPAPTKPDSNPNRITSLEYITIQMIIDYLYNIFITNPEIFTDINFKNKITTYTNSKKFKSVFAFLKNNYSPDFMKVLNERQIIKDNEIDIDNINIPKL